MTQNNRRKWHTLSLETDVAIGEHIDAIHRCTDAIKDFTSLLTGQPHLIREDAVRIRRHAKEIIKLVDAETVKKKVKKK